MKVLRNKKLVVGLLFSILVFIIAITVRLSSVELSNLNYCEKSEYFNTNVKAFLNESFTIKQCQSVHFEDLNLKLIDVTFGQAVGGAMAGNTFVDYDVEYKGREYSSLTELPYSLETLKSDYETYSTLMLVDAASVCDKKETSRDVCWYRYATQTSLDPEDCMRIPEESGWRTSCLKKLAEDYFPELCKGADYGSGWCQYQTAILKDDPQKCGSIIGYIPMQSCFKYFVDKRGLECSTLKEDSDTSKCERQKERFYEVLGFFEEVKSSNDINNCRKVMEFNLYKDCFNHFAKIQRGIGDDVCMQVDSEVYKALCKSSF